MAIYLYLFFCIGTACIYLIPSLPSMSICAVGFSTGVILLLFAALKRSRIFISITALIAGIFWPLLYLQNHMLWSQHFIEHLPKVMVLSGDVQDIKKESSEQLSFVLHLTPNNSDHSSMTTSNLNNMLPNNSQLAVSWYHPPHPLSFGETWQLCLHIRYPMNLRNPGSFDWRMTLLQQRVNATATVRSCNQNRLLSRHTGWINWQRNQIASHLDHHMPLHHALMKSLIIGDRRNLLPEQWRIFQATGTSHLISISGLHIALIAMLAYKISAFCWRLFPFLCRKIPAQQSASIAAILSAIIYSLLAGLSVSTLRSTIMVLAMMMTYCLGRFYSPPCRLLMALFLVNGFDPLASLSISYYLSFGAVAFIYYLCIGRRPDPNASWFQKIKSDLSLQSGISIGLIPLSLYYFQQTSWVSLFANAVAIPWVSFIVLPMGMLGTLIAFFTPLSHVILWLADKSSEWIMLYLTWVAHFPHVLWIHTLGQFSLFILVTIGVLLLLAPKAFPGRSLSLFCLLPLIYLPAQMPKGQLCLVDVLDVGQGLSVVVRTAHHVLLYDTGPTMGPLRDAGSSVVLPYLRMLGITHLDQLILSHTDLDHRGGAQSIYEGIAIERVMGSAPSFYKTFNVDACIDGQRWVWDGVSFEFLHPSREQSGERANDASCVLKIRVEQQAVLLPGDIEEPGEMMLLEHHSKELQSTVLVSPHHGSKTSSSIEFLHAVNPKLIVVSSGYQNRYHLPNPEIIKRYRSLPAQVYDTAHEGGLTLEINPGHVNVRRLLRGHSTLWS